ncbi:MAG: biotin/lipoyl-binding carrier protein, partial [Mycobacteriaceae bacterium]
VSVAVGDVLAQGDTVVILESMKMEIPVLVEEAGTVESVAVAEGDDVQPGDVLAVVA